MGGRGAIRFVYHRNVERSWDQRIAEAAAAMGEPARARMLGLLLDGRARTATELALVAEVSPSTASAHLRKLESAGLIARVAQGKHRYFRLAAPAVARALEQLGALAGAPRASRVRVPEPLRLARTCYDHMAGRLGVGLLDMLIEARWLEPDGAGRYSICDQGERNMRALGVRLDEARTRRRAWARACLDWSERRPHLGGALGAAWLDLALRSRWVRRESDSRALEVTAAGHRELERRLGVRMA